MNSVVQLPETTKKAIAALNFAVNVNATADLRVIDGWTADNAPQMLEMALAGLAASEGLKQRYIAALMPALPAGKVETVPAPQPSNPAKMEAASAKASPAEVAKTEELPAATQRALAALNFAVNKMAIPDVSLVSGWTKKNAKEMVEKALEGYHASENLVQQYVEALMPALEAQHPTSSMGSWINYLKKPAVQNVIVASVVGFAVVGRLLVGPFMSRRK